MRLCPCDSGQAFVECCAPYLAGSAAPTALALMRSRYTAYVERDIDYLMRTTDPESTRPGDRAAAERWAHEAAFTGLSIVACERGEITDTIGVVEFVARYRAGAALRLHHERSRFRRHEGRWVYRDGVSLESGRSRR